MIQTVKNNGRKLTLLALALGLIATGASSFAILTDQLSVTSQLSVMSIDLDANGGLDTVNFAISFTDAPSETRTVDLQNNGNGELRYAMTSTATGELASKVNVKVTLPEGGSCTGTGTVISNAGTGLTGVTIGSPAQGAQAGDRVLAAGATERVCVTWTPTAVLAATDTASSALNFAAEQTAGN